jgi:hypothetical protein
MSSEEEEAMWYMPWESLGDVEEGALEGVSGGGCCCWWGCWSWWA